LSLFDIKIQSELHSTPIVVVVVVVVTVVVVGGGGGGVVLTNYKVHSHTP
jgi:hypothetical protein